MITSTIHVPIPRACLLRHDDEGTGAEARDEADGDKPVSWAYKGRDRVKEMLFALAVIYIGCSVGIAGQSATSQDSNLRNRRVFLDARAPDLPPQYSRSEIRKMIHNAKTPDDFRRLADYFDFRAMDREQNAEKELKELQRLLALSYHARNYGTQVDNTRQLIRHYKAQARECSARATAYRARSNVNLETK